MRRRALPQVRDVLCQVNPMLRYVQPDSSSGTGSYVPDLISFISSFGSAVNAYDNIGHLVRIASAVQIGVSITPGWFKLRPAYRDRFQSLRAYACCRISEGTDNQLAGSSRSIAVFDLGGMLIDLIDWDRRHLYRKLFTGDGVLPPALAGTS